MKYALAYASSALGPEYAWASMQPMVEKAIEAGDFEAAQIIANYIAHTGYGQMLQTKINVASAQQAKAQAAQPGPGETAGLTYRQLFRTMRVHRQRRTAKRELLHGH